MSTKTEEQDEAVLVEALRILEEMDSRNGRRHVAVHFFTGHRDAKFFGVYSEGQVRGSLDRLAARGDLVKFKQQYGKMNAWTTPEIFAQIDRDRIAAEELKEQVRLRWATVDKKLVERGLPQTLHSYSVGHMVPLETIEALLDRSDDFAFANDSDG